MTEETAPLVISVSVSTNNPKASVWFERLAQEEGIECFFFADRHFLKYRNGQVSIRGNKLVFSSDCSSRLEQTSGIKDLVAYATQRGHELVGDFHLKEEYITSKGGYGPDFNNIDDYFPNTDLASVTQRWFP